MSTLRCTNLQDTSGGNSLTTAQIYNGAAKAWVNFNGTGTVAIRASFNVSSITDNGTGDYTVNFSSALSDANYVVLACSDTNNNINNRNIPPRIWGSNAISTTSFRTTNYNEGNVGSIDISYAMYAVFR